MPPPFGYVPVYKTYTNIRFILVYNSQNRPDISAIPRFALRWSKNESCKRLRSVEETKTVHNCWSNCNETRDR